MRSLPDLSVRNPVLVNLMMWAIIIGGVYASMTLTREMFPETSPDRILIRTPYPGASPSEVEKGISIKIEEQIKDIEGVEDIDTTITEGLSTIAAICYNEVKDLDRVVTDIKNAVDSIPRDDFPDEAEETIVSRFEPLLPVIQISWFGDMTDKQLKIMGKRVRDDVLSLPGITKVRLAGTRLDEISVEVDPAQSVRYGLSFMEIADAIRVGNLDLPGGQVKTEQANVAVRTLGEKDRGEELAELLVRALPGGEVIRLKDVATVIDGFQDVDLASRIDGKSGVSVTVSKTASQDAVDIARKVKALVAGKNREPFQTTWMERLTGKAGVFREIYERAYADPYPKIGMLKTHNDLSRFIEGRLDLLQRNGFWGLVLVFFSLLLFLNWRVAFWVMMGLLLAILGTMIMMNLAGVTLNLISMFGLIVVLGMLVDDAIIVGEHTYTKIEEGVEPALAAIQGADEVTKPVTCAIATTMVAFAPLLFITGMTGDFMRVLPVIVMCSLGISLIEALSILPSHLAESFVAARRSQERRAHRPQGRLFHLGERFRAAQAAILEGLFRRGYEALLRRAISYRYVTIAAAVSALVLCGGMITGGQVPIVPFQKMDAETLIGELEMPVGTPIEQTDACMRVIEGVAGDLPEMRTRYAMVGGSADVRGTGAGTINVYPHVGQIIMELAASEDRTRASDDLLKVLREKTAQVTGVKTLTFSAMEGGPGGADIQFEISSENLEDVVGASQRIKEELRGYAGVYDIEDDFDSGQREVQLELLDSGRVLGLTTESLALQVRGAFYGLEARKIQRDREDVRIMVRYPRSARSHLSDLEQMRIATPAGHLVPIGEVARITEGSGFATIRRKNQNRTVIVRAAVDQKVANAGDIIGKFTTPLTPAERAQAHPPRLTFGQLERDYRGIRFEQGGSEREFMKAFSSLKRDGIIALLGVYVLLVALFKRYTQPLIVMAAIPFGAIGAVLGHFVMGYPLTMLSMIGLVALTGIVVNDSLILVEFINRRVESGVPPMQAVVEGGRARLRAIILTSITTILGLAPLLSEQSFQAKFLIPMGISIAFGLAFATLLTLVLVPCLYLVGHDIRNVIRAIWRILWPEPKPATASS